MSSWLCGYSGSSSPHNTSRSSDFSNPRIERGKKVAISQDDTKKILNKVAKKLNEGKLSKKDGDKYIKKGSPKVKEVVAHSRFYTDQGRKKLLEYAISAYKNDDAIEHPPFKILFHLT